MVEVVTEEEVVEVIITPTTEEMESVTEVTTYHVVAMVIPYYDETQHTTHATTNLSHLTLTQLVMAKPTSETTMILRNARIANIAREVVTRKTVVTSYTRS